MKSKHLLFVLVLSVAVASPSPRLSAQEASITLVAEPAAVSSVVGTQTSLAVRAVNAAGDAVEMDIRFAAPRSALRYRDGVLHAYQAGNFEIVATGVLPAGAAGTPPTLRIPVDIAWPAVDRVELNASGASLYVGTTITHAPVALHVDGTRRPAAAFLWSSSDPAVASVDATEPSRRSPPETSPSRSKSMARRKHERPSTSRRFRRPSSRSRVAPTRRGPATYSTSPR